MIDWGFIGQVVSRAFYRIYYSNVLDTNFSSIPIRKSPRNSTTFIKQHFSSQAKILTRDFDNMVFASTGNKILVTEFEIKAIFF